MARDPAGVPVLVALLKDAPFDIAARAEELLAGVAGTPVTKIELTQDRARRDQVYAAWNNWWQDRQGKVDWSRVDLDGRQTKVVMARKIANQCVTALLHLDPKAFKKTLRFPIYMEGLSPNGQPLDTEAQIDALFKQLEMVPQIKQQFKEMSFAITRVVPGAEYLKSSMPANDFRRGMAAKEDAFLKKFRKREILVVYLEARQNGRRQNGGEGAVFVRTAAGRAWVIGFGSARAEAMKK
jgi:hypothetical protein